MTPRLHRDLIGYGSEYPAIEWPNHAKIAISLVIHFEEGAELPLDEEPPEFECNAEGFGIVRANRKRNWNLDSMFEYGTRRGIWRILDMLDRHNVKASFFCAGQALEQNPIAAREIAERGHEVCGHGYRLVYEYNLSRKEEREHIAKAVRVIKEMTGERPRGWNSRGPGPNTRQLLLEGGFTYDSDSYSDDLPYFVNVNGTRFLTIPYSLDVNDDKFWAALMLPGYTCSRDFYQMMKASFDQLYLEGETKPKMMSVGIHLRISGRPSRTKQIEDFIKYAKSFSHVWFARRVDIADWWLERYSDCETVDYQKVKNGQ